MKPNIPAEVEDKEIFWDTLECENGWKLQQNLITKHARILNKDGVRVAWGNLREMRSAIDWIIKPWKECKLGDIIAVHRYNGVYAHYAVYVGQGKVIHYAQDPKAGKADSCRIHKADFSEFLKTENHYEIIHFQDDGSDPIHEYIDALGKHVTYGTTCVFPKVKAGLRCLKGYHLYSAKETVERAKSRIGETQYNLALNNCEHFALWCKTGLKESSQVDDLWKKPWDGRTKYIPSEIKLCNLLLV